VLTFSWQPEDQDLDFIFIFGPGDAWRPRPWSRGLHH